MLARGGGRHATWDSSAGRQSFSEQNLSQSDLHDRGGTRLDTSIDRLERGSSSCTHEGGRRNSELSFSLPATMFNHSCSHPADLGLIREKSSKTIHGGGRDTPGQVLEFPEDELEAQMEKETEKRAPEKEGGAKKCSAVRQMMKNFGPGIIFAAESIGVSHIVQSTRAGARYGFTVTFFILLANVAKYPFFEIGTRYAAGTGESLLRGYQRMGPWILWVFFGFMVVYLTVKIAALSLVTAGAFSFLFGIPGSFKAEYTAGLVIFTCTLVLSIGKFSVMETMMKIVAATLTLTTLVAVFAAIAAGKQYDAPDASLEEFFTSSNLSFIIALMGWMPTGLEGSTFISAWSIAKMKKKGMEVNIPGMLQDLRVGYSLAVVLALAFMTLGVLLLHGSGAEFSSDSATFAGQIVTMYENALGSWCRYLIAPAAFVTFLSVTLTVHDGSSRVMTDCINLFGVENKIANAPAAWLVGFGAFSFFLLLMLGSDLKFVVDLATSSSFCVAPLIALLNFLSMRREEVKPEARLSKAMKALSVFGIAVLSAFTVLFFINKTAPALLGGDGGGA
uniref:Amino acid transporter transmembrane domain-containing protein n=1 Tax=Chromera velia CCMP2878 TaxID=1169474 RepID=A0A0G4G132_9ALVE|eukprot:Cvel_19734.t1-p1 / transcript=Cvel_19734.t1 / gene=Cvel_19734 / organism=Chromera_velia_CCMP2878 / gene_product=Uncharacterized protein PM0681, putative / transcript_product=Uncharacterized protein PM0681, putative / location=Cvel_scaffold1726:4257-6804(+) / protein_length=560 / sequence_SO=supercontig / SO=protein_coding / is_pseudo=false